MNYSRIFLIFLIGLSLTSIGFASGSGHSHSHGDDKAPGKEKTTHISSSQLRIDTKTIKGVKARIDVVALDEIQKDGDKLFTHRLNAIFINAKSGKAIDDGSVALRFTDDHDETGNFINLTSGDKGFETFLFLPKKGEQHMMLAARLNKEKVRQFHFHFKVK